MSFFRRQPATAVSSPKVDIVEKENQFEVHASLPGMTKEDIKIDLKNELLTISGERSKRTKRS